jgi:ATP-dependent 26S proteasome regulatory subunit
LILEADPEKKREIEQRTADELEQAKLQFQSDTEDAKSRVSDDQKNRLERLRAQHQAKKERIKQAKEKELSRLTTEDLSAGGPGGWLETVQQTRVVVDGTTGSQVRLMPGTQIRRQEGKIVVMSGPFTGREVTMTNEQFVPNFDLHLIHEHYRGLL